MTATLRLSCFVIVPLLLLSSWLNPVNAQPLDYDKAMGDIMTSHMPDYPESAIKAFDKLFSGTNVDDLPARTRFLYDYYYGNCLMGGSPDDAIEYFKRAWNVACSYPEVGIRNAWALDAEMSLADLYLAKGSDEYVAGAMLLYNDVITVGISLLDNPAVGALVVRALIEEAGMGVKMWFDEGWVRKIWIQARDIALELDDETICSYYVSCVLRYYCDLGDYDTALSFMEDAWNKGISKDDASSASEYARVLHLLSGITSERQGVAEQHSVKQSR